MTAEAGTALVLGGGGVAGIAWMTGLLAGLADAGQDVTGAGRVIGTSAGATVTAQLGSGLPLEDLVARQVDPARQSAEIFAEVNFEAWGQALAPYLDQAESLEGQLRQYGTFALAAAPVAPEADRLAVIASRLPSHDWPRATSRWSRWTARRGRRPRSRPRRAWTSSRPSPPAARCPASGRR